MKRAPMIAVIGAGDAPPSVCETAFLVGREVAAAGAVLICGGLGGVMAAAARGARRHGGHTVGILPGSNAAAANEFIEFAIATTMGEARNAAVVGSADAVIALAGEGGTLSEIGFALKMGRPIVALAAWNEIAGVRRASSPAEAVAMALAASR